MQYKGVIFDLDGTLVDSIEDLADAVNHVLRNRNFQTYDYKTYRRLIGNGLKKLINDTLPADRRNARMQEECLHELFDFYADNCLNKTRPYDGIEDVLNVLDSKRIKYAVLSNKADDFTKKIVSDLFPNRQFICVEGVKNEAHKKPNPAVALKIAEVFDLNPEEIMFVGDSGVDMQTANNAGMPAVGALWGFKSKQEIKQNGAKFLIDHPEKLIEIISSRNN